MARAKPQRRSDEPLSRYQAKRDFARTPEPRGGEPVAGAELRFVVQRHRARALHYDVRFEIDGVLASWAVPRGPSLDPAVRRLAVHVEDHPLEYVDFEGVIPHGEYGGGDVIVWDRGRWAPYGTDDPAAAVAEADALIGEVMTQRGYPGGDFEQRLADVALAHPSLMEHYKNACDIAHRGRENKAGTEDLRQAMVHYRALFEELLVVSEGELVGTH